MSPPLIEPRWCTCGKQLMWCGVRGQWVDSSHRASHDVPVDGGTRRQPHNEEGVKP